jgi:hypothetical protein
LVVVGLWQRIIAIARLPLALAPNSTTANLLDWLQHTTQAQPQARKKQRTSLVHLTWWMLWKERNNHVFNNMASSMNRIQASILEEARIWRDAGKIKVFDLLHRPREPD